MKQFFTENMALISFCLSSAALALSVFTIFYKMKADKERATANAHFASLAKFADLDFRIKDVPTVFKYYGIDDYSKALYEHGITLEEFSYLLSSFTLAEIFYRTAPNKEILCAEDSYRDKMFQTSHMREAWPLIKRFLSESEFTSAMENLCKKYKSDKEPNS